MAESDQIVRVDIEDRGNAGRVAHVIVSRPGKLNTLTQAHSKALHGAFLELANDPDLRVVVLTGGGDRAFTRPQFPVYCDGVNPLKAPA